MSRAHTQAEIRRSIRSHAESQVTISRLGAQNREIVARNRKLRSRADDARPLHALQLNRIKEDLTHSEQIAVAAVALAEQLQGLLNQAAVCTQATSRQIDTDRCEIDMLSAQLLQIREEAEASAPELLAQVCDGTRLAL